MGDDVKNIEISAEMTPNPNTLKFVVNKMLLDKGSINIASKEKADKIVVAKSLFGIENVTAVMIGPSFISVTKKPEAAWDPMVGPIAETIRTELEKSDFEIPQEVVSAAPNDAVSEIETKIKAILDKEIRPAVAQDGGDIIFYGYEDGVVTLHLQGACSSCPSSVMTLKMGVENRLKEMIPEVKEVVQV